MRVNSLDIKSNKKFDLRSIDKRSTVNMDTSSLKDIKFTKIGRPFAKKNTIEDLRDLKNLVVYKNNISIKTKKSQKLNMKKYKHLFEDEEEPIIQSAKSGRKITYDNLTNRENSTTPKPKSDFSVFNDQATTKQCYNNSILLKNKREELSKSAINSIPVKKMNSSHFVNLFVKNKMNEIE